MRTVDRVILIVLALGVWALVLKPTELIAHFDNDHACTGKANSRLVQIDGDEGELEDGSISVSCKHE